VRIIGDVHGHIERYQSLLVDCDASVQVGDVGFADNYMRLSAADADRHRFIPGNHDDYDHLPPHALVGASGDALVGDLAFFFVRGAVSVDKAQRVEGVSWWSAEQLTFEQGNEALRRWEASIAQIVISHDCPTSMLPSFVTFPGKIEPSYTNELLEEMFRIRAPYLWVFGHHHLTQMRVHRGTTFICLGELEYIDYQTSMTLRYRLYE
jgi:predicted phosphodiesterase